MNYGKLLEGKKALITSGAHGMGYAISKMFVKHGADVAFCGRSPSGAEVEAEFRKLSPDSFFYMCDVLDGGQIDGFCAEALKRFGYVDVIVNNVGINIREPIHAIAYDAFETVFATNFRPIVRINNNLLPALIEKKLPGSVIHISTVHSLATVPSMGSYVASKGAMVAFSRAMAVELGRYNIRSNVVSPGGVFTMPAYNTIVEWMNENPGKSYKQEVAAKMNVDVLSGDAAIGIGHAEDIAHACLYFASDMSAYVTGMMLMQDGGASYQAHKVREYPAPDYFEEISREYQLSFPYPEPGGELTQNTSGQVDRVKV